MRSTFRAIWLLVPDPFSVPGQSTRRDDLNTGRTARTRRVGTSAEVVSVLSLAVNMRPGSQRGLVCKSDTKSCLFRRIQQLLCRICLLPPDRIQYIGKNCCRATKSSPVCCLGDCHAAPSVLYEGHENLRLDKRLSQLPFRSCLLLQLCVSLCRQL